MSMWAAKHGGMRHIRQLKIIDIFALSGQQARVFDPLHVLADPFQVATRFFTLPRRWDDMIFEMTRHAATSVTACIFFAADIIDFTMFWYPVHRQRFPEIASRTSSSVGLGFFDRSSIATINIPGVQNPHCSPCSSQNACCNGCSFLIEPSESTVVTSKPSACTANIKQERTAEPSTITVQAPQTPCSQPT